MYTGSTKHFCLDSVAGVHGNSRSDGYVLTYNAILSLGASSR